MSSERDSSTMSFLLGAAVGGIAALLLAPRSGKETRRRLREEAEALQDRGAAAVQTASEEARALAAETGETVKDRAEAVEEQLKSTVDDATGSALGQVDAVREATSEAKRAYRKEMDRRT